MAKNHKQQVDRNLSWEDRVSPADRVAPATRWLRNRAIADTLGVTPVTIWRWQRDPTMNFPSPSVINGVPFTSADELDAWMKSRVLNRTHAKQVA